MSDTILHVGDWLYLERVVSVLKGKPQPQMRDIVPTENLVVDSLVAVNTRATTVAGDK
jgi:hypothetical protein